MYLPNNPAANVRCITNNPKMLQKLSDAEFHNVGVAELFQIVLKEVQKGFSLIVHPLYGSIRPDVSPYKSILIAPSGNGFDLESFDSILKAIDYTTQLNCTHPPIVWDEKSLIDFQDVDYAIISGLLV